jgi:hypothetical protein
VVVLADVAELDPAVVAGGRNDGRSRFADLVGLGPAGLQPYLGIFGI